MQAGTIAERVERRVGSSRHLFTPEGIARNQAMVSRKKRVPDAGNGMTPPAGPENPEKSRPTTAPAGRARKTTSRKGPARTRKQAAPTETHSPHADARPAE